MVVGAVRTYVDLVSGLSRASRDRARAAARGLLAQAGLEGVADDAEKRVGKLTEEILDAGRANRELLEKLVAGEVTKAASRLGFVRSDDLDEVREEIAELRAQLARDRAARDAAAPAGPRAAKKAPAKKAPAKKAPAKKAPAKKSPARKAPGKKATEASTTEESVGSPTRRAPGAGRATSTRPGAAQRLASQAATVPTAPDPSTEAGA